MDLRKTWYTAQYQSLEQQDAVPLLVRMLYPRLLFPPKFTCTTRNHEPRPRTVPTFSLNLTFACHFCFLFWLDRAYVFLKFNICLSLLFPILVRSLAFYVVLALIFSILFNIIFSLYEVVVSFCICRFRTSFLCFLSGVVFVLCLSLFSAHFPSFNQNLLLSSLLLYVCSILSE